MGLENKGLQIVQLTAQNVTNLKAIQITPEGKAVVLSGANEAGKSNVLNLIKAMLEGLKLKMPIRDGEERAQADIDLGDIKIKRVWTPKGDQLEVYSLRADGKKDIKTSPQAFLNDLTGRMIDPMNLLTTMNDSPKRFRDILAKLVGLDVTEIEADKKAVYDERKGINDLIRDSIAQLKGLTAPASETPNEVMTFKDELDKMNQLREKRDTFLKAQQEKEKIQEEHIYCLDTIKYKTEAIEALQQEIIALNQSREGFEGQLQAHVMPESISPEQIIAAEAALQDVEDKNVTIRSAIRYREHIKEAEKRKKEADKLTQRLDRLEQDKTTRIANCAFPVPGLALTDDYVTYAGKPLDIASDGRKIRIFTKIAMAMSPNVKVLLIKDGSLLDSQGFKEICQIAEESGYQIWMEKVSDSGEVGIFIENGEIKAIDGVATEEPKEAEEAEEKAPEQPESAPEKQPEA